MKTNKIACFKTLLALGTLTPVPVLAETLFAVAINEQEQTRLMSFDSATPGTLISGPTLVTGLQAGEALSGIDVRPATRQLYGLGADGTGTFRLYTVNTATGAATQVGAAFALPDFALPGFDFNPAVDRIRVISESGLNFRLHPDTGAIVDSNAGTAGVQLDTALAFAPGDVNAFDTPVAVGAGYTNSVAMAASTTLYVIESTNNILTTQGGVNGTPNPNGGQLFTVGSGLTSVQTPIVGFDITPGGAAFLATTTVGSGPNPTFTGSVLSSVNLTTGVASTIGAISTAANNGILGIAVAPPSVQFSAPRFNVNENAGTATITVTRTNGSSGAITVNYATSDGTALAASDYTASNGIINFADGDTAPKTFTVPITNDSAREGEETLNLTLSAPVGNVALGAVSNAILAIIDDEKRKGGGGCVINTRAGFDPLLPVIVLLSLGYLLRRRFGTKR